MHRVICYPKFLGNNGSLPDWTYRGRNWDGRVLLLDQNSQ